jgi:hypothetical protein
MKKEFISRKEYATIDEGKQEISRIGQDLCFGGIGPASA